MNNHRTISSKYFFTLLLDVIKRSSNVIIFFVWIFSIEIESDPRSTFNINNGQQDDTNWNEIIISSNSILPKKYYFNHCYCVLSISSWPTFLACLLFMFTQKNNRRNEMRIEVMLCCCCCCKHWIIASSAKLIKNELFLPFHLWKFINCPFLTITCDVVVIVAWPVTFFCP